MRGPGCVPWCWVRGSGSVPHRRALSPVPAPKGLKRPAASPPPLSFIKRRGKGGKGPQPMAAGGRGQAATTGHSPRPPVRNWGGGGTGGGSVGVLSVCPSVPPSTPPPPPPRPSVCPPKAPSVPPPAPDSGGGGEVTGEERGVLLVWGGSVRPPLSRILWAGKRPDQKSAFSGLKIMLLFCCAGEGRVGPAWGGWIGPQHPNFPPSTPNSPAAPSP